MAQRACPQTPFACTGDCVLLEGWMMAGSRRLCAAVTGISYRSCDCEHVRGVMMMHCA